MPYEELSKGNTYIFFTEKFCFHSTCLIRGNVLHSLLWKQDPYFDCMLRRYGMTLCITKGVLQLLSGSKFTWVLNNEVLKTAKAQNQIQNQILITKLTKTTSSWSKNWATLLWTKWKSKLDTGKHVDFRTMPLTRWSIVNKRTKWFL